MKNISIVCIGNELLEGRTTDRNSVYLAHLIRDHDAEVIDVQWIRDDEQAIIEALERASQKAEIVVVSGGLGPTSDDITRESVAAWLNQELIVDPEQLDKLKAIYAHRNLIFTQNNQRQCMFPASSQIFNTEVGTAPGFSIKKASTDLFFFPGVPREFQWFVGKYLLPILESGITSREKYAATMQFHGLRESELENKLENISSLAHEYHARVGYRASHPIIEVSLSCTNPASLTALRDHVLARIGPWLVGQNKETIAQRLGRLLLAQKATVSVAESCTGGGVGQCITSVSGSSKWFERGYIVYSNQAKVDELSVNPETLETFGAVSAQIVCQMAIGAQKRSGSTYALATSGIAGPTGGTPNKPVGTVHFALATPHGVYHQHVLYNNDAPRERIRNASIYTSLSMLIWMLEDKLSFHPINGPFPEVQIIDGMTLIP